MGYESRSGLYRSRKGVIFGVCRGVAEYFDISVGMTRGLSVIALIFTGFWPIGAAYIVAALLMKPEPALPLQSAEEEDFYASYAHSREVAMGRLRRAFDRLDRRLQRMESVVTAKDYDWDERLRNS
ncbi:MAG: PspC domain-containing protein [Candidatus Hydrogenedentes bacterium]|nr:PspC domain-containing protein [Candidatus Hydrogenedentota bacterium]